MALMLRLLADWSRDAVLRAALAAVALSVLVTGSVITVGEARTLLTGGRP